LGNDRKNAKDRSRFPSKMKKKSKGPQRPVKIFLAGAESFFSGLRSISLAA
jgi:hypothetical protein